MREENEIPQISIEERKLVYILDSKSDLVRRSLRSSFQDDKLFAGVSFLIGATLSKITDRVT
jgi:hypothetical protein